MSKDFDYPTHMKDLNQLPDENNPHSHGGPENLPNLKYDAEDDFGDGAKGWTGDQSAFE